MGEKDVEGIAVDPAPYPNIPLQVCTLYSMYNRQSYVHKQVWSSKANLNRFPVPDDVDSVINQ
jgi:hypothetical protein